MPSVGGTDLSSYQIATPVKGRSGIILIASSDISDTNIFTNGLHQNILILYDLFEGLGYTPFLVQNTLTADKSSFFKKYNTLLSTDIIKKQLCVKLYLEIGMSLDAITQEYIRSSGAKIVRLYLGNILNIDIEMIQNIVGGTFQHHLLGSLDEIWMSPHYKQNLEYGCVVNRVPISCGKIAPYVWEDTFVKAYNLPKWRSAGDWRKMDIVIVEPNISFQKCYFYPLLLAEAFSRKYPEWCGKIVFYNGERMNLHNHFKSQVLPQVKARIQFEGRKNIRDILLENPSALFIGHQWNNDFNYLTLELMYCGFPVLHNSEGWAGFGYNYDINKWDEAIELLRSVLENHSKRLAVYTSHIRQLMLHHSIYNPDIQQKWIALINGTNDNGTNDNGME